MKPKPPSAVGWLRLLARRADDEFVRVARASATLVTGNVTDRRARPAAGRTDTDSVPGRTAVGPVAPAAGLLTTRETRMLFGELERMRLTLAELTAQGGEASGELARPRRRSSVVPMPHAGPRVPRRRT